jgi:hypothetical protein
MGVLLVFLAGVFAGSLGMGMYLKHQIKRFGPDAPPRSARHGFIMEKLSRKLDLTKTQRAEIEKIVKASQRKFSAVRNHYMPQIEEISDQSFAAMKTKLNPEQQKKLEEIEKKIQRRHAEAFINSITAGNSPQQRILKLKEYLHLTQAQITALQPVIQEDHDRLEQIIETHREQDRFKIKSVLKEMEAVRNSTDKQFEKILTQTQMENYRNMQSEHLRH